MLALKLFKDSMLVILQSEARVFRGAFLLLLHATRPMLVMIFPISLFLAQMGLWYQSRPLLPGEEAIVTVKLNDNIEKPWPTLSIEPTPAAKVTIGPVRVFSKRQIFWKIKALENGKHHLAILVDGHRIEKELVIGDGFMRVSSLRPDWSWAHILMHPAEEPLRPDSVVQSVNIDYPDRLSWTSGTDWWLVYFFVASMVFAFILKPFLKVRI
jgi:uncharacterized membrane protein (DUF106 family)